ncbi:hypothetical protein [Nocardia wallacei]|uniref:hypothetical protein n=1 Tax=Nocardia wallacei TaxID=480035 RepID=UPI002456E30F|nr:hypothetical protein [Nocardia wallacei]
MPYSMLAIHQLASMAKPHTEGPQCAVDHPPAVIEMNAQPDHGVPVDRLSGCCTE